MVEAAKEVVVMEGLTEAAVTVAAVMEQVPMGVATVAAMAVARVVEMAAAMEEVMAVAMEEATAAAMAAMAAAAMVVVAMVVAEMSKLQCYRCSH